MSLSKKIEENKKKKTIINNGENKTITEYGLEIVKDYKNLPDPNKFKDFPEKQVMIKAIDMYKFLMSLVIKNSDFHIIVSKKTGQRTPYLKRSGFSKIAQAFNITTLKLDEKFFEIDGIQHAEVTVRAIIDNKDPDAIKLGIQAVINSGQFTPEQVVLMIEKLGRVRYADGVGTVGMDEIKYDGGKTKHNLLTYAFTRARNRAIADIAGFSIMSAIEISREIEDNLI